MSILEQIVAHKYREVDERKSLYPIPTLEKSEHFLSNIISLKNSLLRKDLFGIITEFKRKSPSKGIINDTALPEKVCCDYISAGCSAISVLTDSAFFGGSQADLTNVRKLIDSPILRKDFIVDEYQIIEARSMGADAILLITEVLEASRIEKLHRFAHSLGLEVLVEVHDENNFSRIPYDAQLVGINSRNLASFSVDQEQLVKLIDRIPGNIIKIAESGIKTVSDYLKLNNAGFNGFLIGELFMNSYDPGKTCRTYISELCQSADQLIDNRPI
jgi:indole-3-glycerol phosphate synthase